MGRGSRIATLLFSTNKHCFITLPEEWSKEFSSSQEIIVFEAQWGEKRKAFFSWNGDFAVSTPAVSSGPVVQINGLLADKAGLKHGQEIILQEQNYISSCQRIHVEPATVDDWEILELNSSQVEDRLLDQVRVVWPGMVLPVWVDRKICIFLKITSTEPAANCVRLDPNTELFVSPSTRSVKQHPPPPLPPPPPTGLSEFVPNPRVNEITTSTCSNESASSKSTNSDSLIGSSASGYISDFDSALSADSLDWTRKSGKASSFSDNGTVVSSQPWEVEEASILREIPLAYRVWHVVSTALTLPRSVDDSGLLDTEEDARRKMVKEFWSEMRVVARVEPLFTKKLDAKEDKIQGGGTNISTSLDTQPGLTEITPHGWGGALSARVLEGYHHPYSAQATFSMLMQPTTVYLSSNGGSEILSQYAEELEQDNRSDYVNFLAFLTKLPSPLEKAMELKEKLAASPPKTDEKQEKEPSQEKSKSAPIRPCVVRVVIHGNELQEHCKGDKQNLYTSTVFDEKPVDWFLQVPDLLRRQIGLELTARVELHAVTKPPKPVHYLILYPLLEKPMEESIILQGFKHWLGCVSCMISPMPVQQHGTLIRFPVCTLKGFVYIEVLLSVNQLERYDDGTPYFLLHPFVLNKASVSVAPNVTTTSKIPGIYKLPYWSIDDVDSALHCPRLQELGGFTDLGMSAINHLAASVLARPLSQSLFAPAPGLCHGGVLICGNKGSGKTSLAKAICRELSEWPFLTYVKIIDCKHLRGKRIEAVQKIWEDAFQEAAWREPSVILLDDLDLIASSPRGPEHEIGPEVVYHSRVAQSLKDLLSVETYAAARISVLVTCQQKSNLHATLTASRGSHLFQVCLQIPPPSQDIRKQVLITALQNRVEVDQQSLSEVDIADIASRMDGFVPRDIQTTVERAIHAASCRLLQEPQMPPTDAPPPKSSDKENEGNKEPEILLCHEDFQVALHNYIPTALRDVPLHSAGELGWEDVGGLKQVKQDLKETLILPTKYPELFSSCPLRLRSGLLLYGPPGTGKTLLGSVVAKECGLNFISIKGPELLSKYIGASEQAVRDLFTRAQSAKPCILFFDEFDSLAPRRGHDNTGVTDRVVNQLLTQLDGVEGLDGVYVIGATSRPDLLDPALLRPGRLDKCLYCPIPTLEERIEIITSLSRNIPMADDVNLPLIVHDCDYFTGADIKSLLYNAQLEAIHSIMPRENKDDIFSELGTPLQIMHTRDMEADDWKLTFLSADGELHKDSRYRRISMDAATTGSGNSSPEVHRRFQRESVDGGRLNKLVTSSTFPPTIESSESTDEQSGNEQSGNEHRGRQTPLLQTLLSERSAKKKHIPHISEFIRDTLENDETPTFPDNFQDSGVFSTGLSPDPVSSPPIFMPSLRDGVVELTGENLNKLSAEVQIIETNYFKRKQGLDLEQQLTDDEEGRDERRPTSLRITQAHLIAGKRSMKPSVSVSEREKYNRIYQAFVESRGGDFKTKEATSQKRATLA